MSVRVYQVLIMFPAKRLAYGCVGEGNSHLYSKIPLTRNVISVCFVSKGSLIVQFFYSFLFNLLVIVYLF